MSVLVKICGITNVDDGLVAVEAGADALGFIMYRKSARFVEMETAAAIINRLPSGVAKVAVFVNETTDAVLEAVRVCGFNILQFHGEETPAYCDQFNLMTVKAFRISDRASISRCSEYRSNALLLDTYSPAAPGGTGETFNWDLAIEVKRFGKPLFLAGGLTPENVGEAVRRVRPYAVDVASGVEAAPGKKNHQKVRAFITAAKQAEISRNIK